MGTAFSNPTNIWPFGLITPTPGTPLPITANVGLQRQVLAPVGNPGAARFAQKVAKLLFMIPATNAGLIYILKPGYSKNQTNGLILLLNPTSGITTINIDKGNGGIQPDDLFVDSVTAGDGVYITALNG